jgi:predicted lipoprotein with Yx(FWY)xxD motif
VWGLTGSAQSASLFYIVRFIILLALAIALLVPLAATAATARPAAATVVKTAYNQDLKAAILVTGTGLTLYEYFSDVPNQHPYPFCVNDPTYHCSKLWPPLLTTGKPIAGKGVKASLLGTVVRDDNHKTQVTYAGHPLYRYAGGVSGPPDKKPGDVYGQNAVSIWYVLSPSGKPIKKPR